MAELTKQLQNLQQAINQNEAGAPSKRALLGRQVDTGVLAEQLGRFRDAMQSLQGFDLSLVEGLIPAAEAGDVAALQEQVPAFLSASQAIQVGDLQGQLDEVRQLAEQAAADPNESSQVTAPPV